MALHAMMQQLATCITPNYAVGCKFIAARPTMSYILLVYYSLCTCTRLLGNTKLGYCEETHKAGRQS